MMKMVSVIIPTFKGEKTIGRALLSLCKQSYENYEVIVVDDNGRDTDHQKETEKVIDLFRHRINLQYIIHEQNLNGAAARNTGIKVAKGDYICFLDDDDIYLTSRLSNAVNYLELNPEVNFYFTWVLITRNRRLIDIIKPIKCDNPQKCLIINSSYFGTGSNIFMRYSVISGVNNFNEAFFRFQDVEFLLRALDRNDYFVEQKIDIIKCNSGTSNLPSVVKFDSSYILFKKTFSHVINSLDPESKLIFENRNATSRFLCCLGKESAGSLKKAKLELEKTRRLRTIEHMEYVLSLIGIPKLNLYSILYPIFSKVRNIRGHNNILRMLDSDTKFEIKEWF